MLDRKALKTIMADKGLSQADLARLTGFSRSVISSYLSGAYRPETDKIGRIAEVLGVPVNDLLMAIVDRKSYGQLLEENQKLRAKLDKIIKLAGA